jgi:hypothetical protein
MGVAVEPGEARLREGEGGTVGGPDAESVVVAEPGRPAVVNDANPDYGFRAARGAVRWNGVPAEETIRKDRDGVRTVDLDDVGLALRQWMRDTRASQLGQTFNVTDPRGAAGLEDWLVHGSGSVGGPVTAVLRALGVDLVESCAACRRQWPLRTPRARICGECGHLWESVDELVDDDYARQQDTYEPSNVHNEWTGGPVPERRSVDAIWSCPCCNHDF